MCLAFLVPLMLICEHRTALPPICNPRTQEFEASLGYKIAHFKYMKKTLTIYAPKHRGIMVLFLFLDATVFSIDRGFELFASLSTLTVFHLLLHPFSSLKSSIHC